MIDKNTVEHLAKLSRLQFTEQELTSYSHDLQEIFNYADNLKKIDTSDIEPSTHALPLYNVLRKDEIKTYEHIEDLMNNAPDLEAHSFKVPRILNE